MTVRSAEVGKATLADEAAELFEGRERLVQEGIGRDMYLVHTRRARILRAVAWDAWTSAAARWLVRRFPRLPRDRAGSVDPTRPRSVLAQSK
jgi:hypothetical protein